MGQDFGQFNLGPDRTTKSKFNAKPLLTVFGIIAAIAIIGAIAYAFINFYLLPKSSQTGTTQVDQQNTAATATAVMMTQEANISIWSTATERARVTTTPAKTQTPMRFKDPNYWYGRPPHSDCGGPDDTSCRGAFDCHLLRNGGSIAQYGFCR